MFENLIRPDGKSMAIICTRKYQLQVPNLNELIPVVRQGLAKAKAKSWMTVKLSRQMERKREEVAPIGSSLHITVQLGCH